VKTGFQYLISDYGFSVTDERYDPQSFGNSLVEFRSKETAIRLVLDRGQVLVDLGPISWDPNSWCSLSSMMEVLAPEGGEPAYVFPETWESYSGMVDWQINRLARLLRQYCSLVLTGQFSGWKELARRRTKEAEDGYRALTGKDFPKLIPR
jgi:hypothetical protein